MTSLADLVVRTRTTTAVAGVRAAKPLSWHVAQVRIADAISVLMATVLAQFIRFGDLQENVKGAGDVLNYTLLSVTIAVAWWFLLGASGSREPRILGVGFEEYKRLITTSLGLFGSIAIFSYVFQISTARGYVAIAAPLGVFGLMVGRKILRSRLHRIRTGGALLESVLVLGQAADARHLAKQLLREPQAGYAPTAYYITDRDLNLGPDWQESIPIIGSSRTLTDILRAVTDSGAKTVAVAGGSSLHPMVLRQLGWELSAKNIGLVIAPSLTDVTGPRIHMQPVGGLPLLHVSTPQLTGLKAFVKRVFDIAGACGLIALFSVPMAITALLVHLDSTGPVFFHQKRIGREGQSFTMHKFRSMQVNAENALPDLQEQSTGNGMLFKMKDDPRVTRVGKFIRRYSIDELPQLFNVVTGTMSLVGPRPPLPCEVEQYDESAHRRLLVKPGITGPWQTSGRSDLSWDDSIALDLSYVENWSMIQDIMYLLKTLRAVVSKDGAY
ncbi:MULTISPECIES: sugar transferase [Arthrobacter]|uniref:Sugar transferase n=2 Tax=Arthrobacter TaxID=1663 RepID=A0ABU9KN18_9MICC|nr:sugar transferase [Arthrobacter sp. YJM1]MDP5227733.1 sugar transferase [Arthrobacter sp. YJM1]